MNSMIRINAATPKKLTPMSQQVRVALRAYTALAELCKGTARTEELEDLTDSANVVEALATMGKFDAVAVSIWMNAAIIGFEVAVRCPDGMMRMGKDATWAMRNLVTMHDVAISKFSQGTMLEAWALVINKIRDPSSCAANGLIVVGL